jgi:hypothetical protein
VLYVAGGERSVGFVAGALTDPQRQSHKQGCLFPTEWIKQVLAILFVEPNAAPGVIGGEGGGGREGGRRRSLMILMITTIIMLVATFLINVIISMIPRLMCFGFSCS